MAGLVGWIARATADAYDTVLTWTPVEQASGYRILHRPAPGETWYAVDAGPIATGGDGLVRARVEGLEYGVACDLAIATYDEAGAERGRSGAIRLDYAAVAHLVDSDGDGLSDADEDRNLDRRIGAGETDPANPDTDGDGLDDGDEVLIHHTDPLSADSDGDGLTDQQEVASGSDPNRDESGCVFIFAAIDPGLTLAGTMKAEPRYAEGDDADLHADSISPELLFADSGHNSFAGGSDDRAVYEIELPAAGPWYAWGRFYYPATGSNHANSFFLRVDDGPLLVFGNNRDMFRRWHWDGNGEIQSGEMAALPLGPLDAGFHVLEIRKREVLPVQPRLDVVCLTRDRLHVPDDVAAAEALLGAVSPTSTTTVP